MTGTQTPRRETRVVSEGFVKRLTAGPGQFFLAIGACLLLVLAVFLITPRNESGDLRPAINYSWDAKAIARNAPYQAWAPENLPEAWRATSSRLTGLNSEPNEAGKKIVSWHLTFLTPTEKLASFEQSNERADTPSGFVRRMTNVYQSSPQQAIGTQTINGASWDKFRNEDKKQNSLVRRMPDLTLIVTGVTDWDELTVLASSLVAQPQAK
ncbi:DUF4245 domain-containing protein [Actinocorallia longicatena]|uniref:DUF4245 domain-containing protein n=1 Tax=Actinocorallia longicatena TaxID=111803 RepID=A0ABP6Q1M7_9ACTN